MLGAEVFVYVTVDGVDVTVREAPGTVETRVTPLIFQWMLKRFISSTRNTGYNYKLIITVIYREIHINMYFPFC